MIRQVVRIGFLFVGIVAGVAAPFSAWAKGIGYGSEPQERVYAVTYSSGQSFYHFPIRLTPENTRMVLPGYKSRYNTAPWTFKDGLFEFYVKKEALPMKTPRCQKYVVVRSPYVPCNQENKQLCQQQRAEREQLFNTIEYSLRNGGGINVVLETIPGFTTINQGKPVLNSCNLYLRTYKNNYINYTGPLRQVEP